MMYEGQIIDTHMHLWDTANGYEWLPLFANGALNRNFLMSDYMKMAKGVLISQTVFIECGGFPKNPLLETKWAQEQADAFGGPQAIVGFAKLDAPNVEEVLKGHSAFPNVRGVRMSLNRIGSFGADRSDYLQDRAWRKGYALLSKYNLHFEMQIFDTQIPDAIDLIKTHPETPVVLEHLGWPVDSTEKGIGPWSERLSQIAAYPNVFLKLSCLGWVFQTRNVKRIIPYLQEAVRLFGPHRCMVGSNCPPDSVQIPFTQIFEILKTALSPYSLIEQQQIFHGNAKRIYRI